MVNIVLSILAVLLSYLLSGFCFYIGYRVGLKKSVAEVSRAKAPTDAQKRITEGLTNMLNYANRHLGGER